VSSANDVSQISHLEELNNSRVHTICGLLVWQSVRKDVDTRLFPGAADIADDP